MKLIVPRPTKLAAKHDDFCASLRFNQDIRNHALMMYSKRGDRAYNGQQRRCCLLHGFLALSEITDAVVLDALSDRCKTKSTWLFIILFVINVVPMNLIRRIVECFRNGGKGPLLASKP